MEKKKFDIKKLTSSREMSLIVVLIILVIFVQSRNSAFLKGETLEDMFRNYAVIFIMALGMMCVMLTGGIDISIGSTLAFSGMAAALVMRDYAISTPLAFAISIGLGTLLGLVVGLVITKANVPPIVCTLGFMNIYRGMTYWIANSLWVAAYQFTDSFKNFALTKYLGFGLVNNMIAVTIYCYILFFVVMKWTTVGRRVYAVGSNAAAAEVSGINVDAVKIAVYTLMGLLAGLSGSLWTSMYKSAQGDMAEGIEMDVIAACVVGGVSMTGGRGTVIGVLLGSLTIAIISKTLPLVGISQFWQNAFKGLIILIAIIINAVTQRTAAKNQLKRREM